MKGFSKFGPNGLRLVVDPKDSDTPAMVYLGNESATFNCAASEGTIESTELTQKQYDWLMTFDHQVDAAYEYARKDLPEYN